MTSSAEFLKLKQLKFSYGDQPILNIPDWTVGEGEMIFLYGPSGSGKSTLLELLAGVLKTQAGEITIDSVDLHTLSPEKLDRFRADKIGYIFQSFNLISYLSVYENILLPTLFENVDSDNEDEQQKFVLHLTEALGLAAFLNRPVSQLSIGQQQRVAVARALFKKPKLILADEPTSALDYNHRENFLKILFKLCREQKTTVLFVSHDRTLQNLFDRSVDLQSINKILIELQDETDVSDADTSSSEKP